MEGRLTLLVLPIFAGCSLPLWTPRPEPPAPQVLTAADPRRQLLGSWVLEFMDDSAQDLSQRKSRPRAASGVLLKGSLEVGDSITGRAPYQQQRALIRVYWSSSSADQHPCVTHESEGGSPDYWDRDTYVWTTVKKKGKAYELYGRAQACEFVLHGTFGEESALGRWSVGHWGWSRWGRVRIHRLPATPPPN